jgi:hypothetical protein
MVTPMTTPSDQNGSGDPAASEERSKVTADVIRAAMALAQRDVDLGLITVEQIESIPRTRFAPVERKKIAEALSAQGVSHRGIAKVTGASPKTIDRDLSASNGAKSASNDAPEKTAKKAKAKRERPTMCLDLATGQLRPATEVEIAEAAKPFIGTVPDAAESSADPPGMPTEAEAEAGYQETLYDQACALWGTMTDDTRLRFLNWLDCKRKADSAQSGAGRRLWLSRFGLDGPQHMNDDGG